MNNKREETFFDMNHCRPGDIVVSVHGKEFEYVGRYPEVEVPTGMAGTLESYPHLLIDLEHGKVRPRFVSRTDSGHVYHNRRLPEDHNIVAFKN